MTRTSILCLLDKSMRYSRIYIPVKYFDSLVSIVVRYQDLLNDKVFNKSRNIWFSRTLFTSQTAEQTHLFSQYRSELFNVRMPKVSCRQTILMQCRCCFSALAGYFLCGSCLKIMRYGNTDFNSPNFNRKKPKTKLTFQSFLLPLVSRCNSTLSRLFSPSRFLFHVPCLNS